MKTFAQILLSLTIAFGACAQTVDFNNTRTFATTADRLVRVGAFPVVGTDYVAQLYYGANASSLVPVTSSPVRFRNIPVTDPLAGTWVGATRTLTGFNLGDVVTLQVWMWDATGGAPYGGSPVRGQSATFTYRIPMPGSIPTDYYIEGFRGFTIPVIPEPASITLVALGAAALLALRRRKVIGKRHQ
jgi:hypothetical protein